MGNLDLYYDHMSTEGSLAFNWDDCHAYSMGGSIGDVLEKVQVASNPVLGCRKP